MHIVFGTLYMLIRNVFIMSVMLGFAVTRKLFNYFMLPMITIIHDSYWNKRITSPCVMLFWIISRVIHGSSFVSCWNKNVTHYDTKGRYEWLIINYLTTLRSIRSVPLRWLTGSVCRCARVDFLVYVSLYCFHFITN